MKRRGRKQIALTFPERLDANSANSAQEAKVFLNHNSELEKTASPVGGCRLYKTLVKHRPGMQEASEYLLLGNQQLKTLSWIPKCD